MIVSLIAAVAENRVIGRNNSLPWDIPEDMERFRRITMGHPVILGRKTFEIVGHPLPGRKNIVLTKQEKYQAEGVVVVHNLRAAFAACGDAEEVFICGGGTIFRETISLAQRLYLTLIHMAIEGDAFFPEIPKDFIEVTREDIDNLPPYYFVLYKRKNT